MTNQVLSIKAPYLMLFEEGKKSWDIRKGRLDIKSGPLTLLSGQKSLTVNVNEVRHVTWEEVSQLPLEDVLKLGATSKEQLLVALKTIYPNTQPNDIFTLIICDPLNREKLR